MLDGKALPIFNRPICPEPPGRRQFTFRAAICRTLLKNNPGSHYWCNCTMQVVGPDDQFVSPDACKQSRNCFAPVGGELVV